MSISWVTFLEKALRKASIMSISRVTFLGKAPHKAGIMSISWVTFLGEGVAFFAGRPRMRPAS